MVINITPNNFGGRLRNGDIVGTLNVLEHLRKNDSSIKFHIPNDSIHPTNYCFHFRNWLLDNTDYLSSIPGNTALDAHNINLWDFRSVIGDLVKIKNDISLNRKICIFPLFDGPYNPYRNWSIQMTNSIIEHYMQSKFDDYEKIVCIHAEYPGIILKDFRYSFDILENIYHITTCSHYVGGDTGMSHFASALDNPHRKLNYYYGSVGLLHTTPFYALQGKGNINMFWNNNWRTDLL